MCLPLLACCCPPVHRVSVGPAVYGPAYIPAVYHNIVPGYGPNVAPAPLFGGRVGRPFAGGATYRGPVITPNNAWQAPGLSGRATAGPVGGFGAPRTRVGTRR